MLALIQTAEHTITRSKAWDPRSGETGSILPGSFDKCRL